MTLSDLYLFIIDHPGEVILCCMSLIQVTPIKVNPWTWVAQHLGTAINKETNKKVQEIGEQVEKLSERVESLAESDALAHSTLHQEIIDSRNTGEKRNAIGVRARIIAFGDKLLENKKPSKEAFNQILVDIDYYENYCCEHPEFENNQAVLTIQQIKYTYSERLKTHDFAGRDLVQHVGETRKAN